MCTLKHENHTIVERLVYNNLKSLFKSEEEMYGFANWLDNMGFYRAPASTKYHGNESGGLAKHSIEVANTLMEFGNNNPQTVKWLRHESPIIVGLFHDLCKIDMYKFNEEKKIYEYSNYPIVTGHGSKSVIYLQRFINLTEQEVACIMYHMGAFTDSKEWNNYTHAISQYPEVLMTHTADMYVSHVLKL